jgi:hypothetical protein
MNKLLRELNLVTGNILQELERDIGSNASPDIDSYLELNKLIMRMDNITSLMLSDINKKRALN